MNYSDLHLPNHGTGFFDFEQSFSGVVSATYFSLLFNIRSIDDILQWKQCHFCCMRVFFFYSVPYR